MKRNLWFVGLLAGLTAAGCGGSSAPSRRDAGTDAKKDAGALMDAGNRIPDAGSVDTAPPKQDTGPLPPDAMATDTTPLSDAIPTDTATTDAGVPDAALVDTGAVDTAIIPADAAPDVPQQADTSIPQLDTNAAGDADNDSGTMGDVMPDTTPVVVDAMDAMPDTTPVVDTLIDTTPGTDAAHLVFTDNFQDGTWEDNWIASSSSGINPSGAWDVGLVGGSLSLNQSQSYGQTRRFMYMIMPGTDAGATSLGDTTVQAKVIITQSANDNSTEYGAKVCARYQVGSTSSVDNVYCVSIFPGATANTGTLRILQGTSAIGNNVATVNVVLNTWYTVKIVVSGTTITTISAYLDGALIATTNDITTPFQTGAVAVGTTGVTAAFDDIVVTTP